jgi:hypothetical protein
MANTAAIVASLILAGLGLFQAALAFDAALGRFAWGGRHERLPFGLRAASAMTIPIYALIAIVLLDRAGAVDMLPDDAARIGAWVVVGYFALGIGMNAVSRSRHERMMMTPVALVLAVLAAIVAVS